MRPSIWAVGFLTCLAMDASAQQPSPPLALEHANVFVGAASPPLHDVTVEIRDGRIASIGPSATQRISPAVQRIDLRGGWLLPGLIDAHVHVADIPGVHRMLALGVTTGRSMLTTGYEDVGLKALYDRGDNDVPDILAAGFPVVARPMEVQPGLSSLFLDNPDLDELRFRDRIGIDGAQRIVLDNAKRHVDWIKVFANGRAGVMSAEPTARDLNDDEIAAAVRQATALGIPSAAHAFTDDGVLAAVNAGVHTIEHGSLLTETALKAMHAHGVCFVPTLSVLYAHATVPADATPPEKVLAARMQSMLKGGLAAVATARALGVSIIAGTDTTYDPDEPTLIDEIRHLADAGFTPAEAIDSATSVSASCLRLDKHKGAIRAALDADLVGYTDNPLADLHILQTPTLVITRGSIYVNKVAKPGT